METEALRTLVTTACTSMGGRLWPNRLGFSWRGWEYVYLENLGCWSAHRQLKYATIYGEGSTPEEARQHAHAQSQDVQDVREG